MGRGGQDENFFIYWARGLSNIEKHGGGGGGEGGYLAKNYITYIQYILKSRRSGAKTLP